MKKSLLAIIIALSFTACKKEACEKESTGTQCFHNTTDVMLEVYYDEEYQYTLAPGEERCDETVKTGEHSYFLREEGIEVLDGTSRIKECTEDQVIIY